MRHFFYIPEGCAFVFFFIAIGFIPSISYGMEIPAYAIIDQNNQPTKALVALLGKLNVKHDGTIESIKSATQQAWLRPIGLEREESPEIYGDIKLQELTPLFEELNIIKKIDPQSTIYSNAVVFSNAVPSFRRRLQTAYALWKGGIKFDALYLLGSKRRLNAAYEGERELTDPKCSCLPFKKDWKLEGQLPTTETDMIKFVYNQAKFKFKFRKIALKVIDVPDTAASDGILKRATTSTQVQEWLKYEKDPTSTLWVSDNPYIPYQDSIVRTFVQSGYNETVGAEADLSKSNIRQDCLDTIARIIYQENVRRQNRAIYN